ncbi:MAG: ABC transporter substrate-binding protein [Gammaproteobacteria bacterium]|nr:MAG: ABC transporter substrate-binding protein [Gammaproteobacteria bacterium]
MACLSAWCRLAHNIVVPLGFLVALAAGPAIAASPTTTPRATIQKVTGDVLAALQANKDALRKDPARVTALITRIVDPYFDYDFMSREALGIAWRRADAQQRARFTQAFHKLLVIDYAEVFKQYTDQTIKLTRVRWDNAAHDRATVLSRIDSSGEQPVQVDYRLYYTHGRWQVYDVVVDGISLLINYRETFISELQRESLDTLISRLQQKVAAKKPPVSR